MASECTGRGASGLSWRLDNLKNFTAVGDVVNTAARLQSAAGAYEVLVSEKVYRGVIRGEKPPAERATLELKGKAEPLTAFILR